MGVAILSGVFESLNRPTKSLQNGLSKWESHTPGTLTPSGSPDATVPTSFLACVRREDTAVKLRRTFGEMGELGQSVEVLASQNTEGVASADVILLW